MLIDCDTCTVRGEGCHDCVVTVLLGAPPGWRGEQPTVVPLTRRAGGGAVAAAGPAPLAHPDAGPAGDHGADEPSAVVELDDVERRAVRALAEFGLVPPLRHQDASMTHRPGESRSNRNVS